MTDKEKKSKIADILMDFQEEYSNEVINRPMLASLYAGNILSFIDSLQEEPVNSVWHDANTLPTNYEIKDILVVYNQYGREYLHLYWEDGVYSDAQGLIKYNWKYVEKWAYIEDLLKLDNSCYLKKNLQEEPTSVWHDANQQPTMYRKYLVRYSDGRVSGSWERHDDGFIPWKDVVKEHGFTHWCYVDDLNKAIRL